MTHQKADIGWSNGVPVSAAYDDPYFSLDGGVAEGAHVFLDGNRLHERLTPGFRIAELGFGTGLNLLLAVRAARAAGALPLLYTGFELHPMTGAQMAQALGAFSDLAEDAAWLVEAWDKGPILRTPEVQADIILGDAADTLSQWRGLADAWFLDGFAPARNPGMWGVGLLNDVARHTAPGGTFATYTAAGHVRRALQSAGFTVTRRPGFGRKRHMTTGILAG